MQLAVVAAMTDELVPFLEGMKEQPLGPSRTGWKGRFYAGTHDGVPLIAARSGLGKVNAALTAQALADVFSVEAIIMVGLAGAMDPSLDVGDIVIGESCVQHDVDLTALNEHQPGLALHPGEILFDLRSACGKFVVDSSMRVIRFPADPQLLALADTASKSSLTLEGFCQGRRPRVVQGVMISGDQFITSADKVNAWVRETFSPMVTEMEAAAVSQVCHLNNIRFLAIKTVSDRADHSAATDFASRIHLSCAMCHGIAMRVLRDCHCRHEGGA